MGGFGSGRWGQHTKKATVEHCLTLDLAQFERAGLLHHPPGNRVYATLRWTNAATGEGTSAASCILDSTGDDIILTLCYRVQNEDMYIPIRIETTRPYFGGSRYWGTCPDCGRRVRKLHVPPGGCRFSCRLCLGLSYKSAQEAHKFDRLSRLITEITGLSVDDVKSVYRMKNPFRGTV